MRHRISLGALSLYAILAAVVYGVYLVVFALDTAFVFVDTPSLWQWTKPLLIGGLIVHGLLLLVESFDYGRIPEVVRRHGLVHAFLNATLFATMLSTYAMHRMGESAPVGDIVNWGWGWSMTGALLVVVLIGLDLRIAQRLGDHEPHGRLHDRDIESPA